MRVIIITNSLSSGGAEKQMLWIARTLVTKGIPCAIFEMQARSSNHRIAELITAATEAGVEFRRAALKETYFTTWIRLHDFVRAHSTAIVWTWGFRSDLSILLMHWLGFKRRWICSLRTANMEAFRSLDWLVHACIEQNAYYASNTYAAREFLGIVHPGSKLRCHVIYNFVPESASAVKTLPAVLPRPLHVVMPGNIEHPKKGYDIVIQLAELIKKECLPIKIHVGGRPDRIGLFAKQIAERELETVLIYHGEVDAPHEFLKSGDCFLLVSRYEGMPNSLLEATSIGLPAITTVVGDLGQLVETKEEMYLVPIEDVAAVKRCLVDILSDWPAAVEMAGRGRLWCERNFAAENCTQQILHLLNDVSQGNDTVCAE